jgi:hypothetical protein
VKIADYVKLVADRVGKLASIALIDCDNFVPDTYGPCRPMDYVLDSFPRLNLLIPPEKRYEPLIKEIQVHSEYPWTEKEMTENSIYNFLVTN